MYNVEQQLKGFDTQEHHAEVYYTIDGKPVKNLLGAHE